MAKIIKKFIPVNSDAPVEVKVYSKNHFGEYRAALFVKGMHDEPSDYYTDNKDDALGTAALMLKQAIYDYEE